MNIPSTICALLLAGLAGVTHAAASGDQFSMDSKAIAERYAQERDNCADERNPGHRKQCLRAAQAEHDKALSAAKANMRNDKHSCVDCGKVTAVNVSERNGDSNAIGLLAGGAAGALLGHQVGGGTGKDIATIAGAVGGAYAGKKIQERSNATKVWSVQVQYDNGQRRSFDFERDPAMRAGDRVRNAGASIARN